MAEKVIMRTVQAVEHGQQPLSALQVAQHRANIIDYAHNFNVETIVKDFMARMDVPVLTQEQMSRVDGRLTTQAHVDAQVPVASQQQGTQLFLTEQSRIHTHQSLQMTTSHKETSQLPKEIVAYLKDYNDTFTLLLEPNEEFKVMEGRIPPPME